MAKWAKPVESREQMVLFARRLDDAVPANHSVRMLDGILASIDWSKWEAAYDGRLGQPPIHPRVLAGVLLYGLLKRIRASRALEDALAMRLDFRWLAEGRQIDHTTLSEFRRKHADALCDLFTQIGLIAQRLGLLPLEQLVFDGTRFRANNRRGATRTPAELRRLRDELAAKYQELSAQAEVEDARDDERFESPGSPDLSAKLADLSQRRTQIKAALAELDRLEEAGETTPKRLPLTDPESRVTPNKEGGFAPNYTPLATVDVASGLIVSADVIASVDEEHALVDAIKDVQSRFDLPAPPAEVLVDGRIATAANLAALDELGVSMVSPASGPDPTSNPALRDDPKQPVAEQDWSRLPTIAVTRDGESARQLHKAAFVYDAARDCYWCPQGKPLEHARTSRDKKDGRQRTRFRYWADATVCANCPLLALCCQGRTKRREITREEHDAHLVAHVQRMATPEARAKYARRRHPGERPFALIKHHFGARRFLLRGLRNVRVEWRWLATAFNLHRLMSLLQAGIRAIVARKAVAIALQLSPAPPTPRHRPLVNNLAAA